MRDKISKQIIIINEKKKYKISFRKVKKKGQYKRKQQIYVNLPLNIDLVLQFILERYCSQYILR